MFLQVSWLASNRPRRFDLVTACDTLIYIGDMRPVVLPASRLLRSRGLFAFTVELGRRYPFTLADSGYCLRRRPLPILHQRRSCYCRLR